MTEKHRIQHRQREQARSRCLILRLGVKPCKFAGNSRPARPSAKTHQCMDQVESVRGVRSRSVRGLAQPGCRARHSSSRFRHLRVGRLRGQGEAIRVLPLGWKETAGDGAEGNLAKVVPCSVDGPARCVCVGSDVEPIQLRQILSPFCCSHLLRCRRCRRSRRTS